jgi:hypothetical protein
MGYSHKSEASVAAGDAIRDSQAIEEVVGGKSDTKIDPLEARAYTFGEKGEILLTVTRSPLCQQSSPSF